MGRIKGLGLGDLLFRLNFPYAVFFTGLLCCKCWIQHSCMSSSFPTAKLTATFFYSLGEIVQANAVASSIEVKNNNSIECIKNPSE